MWCVHINTYTHVCSIMCHAVLKHSMYGLVPEHLHWNVQLRWTGSQSRDREGSEWHSLLDHLMQGMICTIFTTQIPDCVGSTYMCSTSYKPHSSHTALLLIDIQNGLAADCEYNDHCVSTTCRQASDSGYNVYLVHDACATLWWQSICYSSTNNSNIMSHVLQMAS